MTNEQSKHHRNGPARKEAGFTLIEIMAVVLIMGMLAALVGGAVFNQVNKGRVTTAKVQIKSLESNLAMYQMDNGRFPTTDQGLEALVQEPSGSPAPRNYPPGGYLSSDSVPLDPWGMPYQYQYPGNNNKHKFDLWSYGADGQPGGDGIDADVGNWSDEASRNG